MKFRTQAYLILFVGLLLTNCAKEKEAEERYTWSTEAPLTIPFKTRIQRLDKGNLIRNHSFENGRIFALDSITSSFVIDGWQQIGKNVEWTDIRNDSLYNAHDAYSGNRAIKIKRTKAYETDQQGDGIISDFIKVIPGNYDLSFFARLEDVKPNRLRLGTKMFDALDISMLFFDRNKIPISADHIFPQIDQMINSSFKGLSFANYLSIPSFGWGKIIGKSACFPYHEGDIPSDAHFVKIRIAFKGTGTCFIDSLSLTYTDKNFSVAERMGEYTDTGFSSAVAVTPTPKKMIMRETIEFYNPNIAQNQLPVIIVPEHDQDALTTAQIVADALQNSIFKNGNHTTKIQILTKLDQSISETSKLVVSVGKTTFYQQFSNLLPLQEINARQQGYFLFTPDDSKNLVLLGANDKQGLFYAAATFVQLIDFKAPVYHNAGIIDYPDFPMRFCTIYETGNQVNRISTDEVMQYKINGAVFLINRSDYKPVAESDPLFQMLTVCGYRTPDYTTLSYTANPDFSNYQYPANAKYVIPALFNNQMLDNADFSLCCNPLPKEVKYIYSGSSFFSTYTDEADILRFTTVFGKNPVFMDNSMLMATKWGQYGGADRFFPGKIRLFNLFEPYNNQEIQKYFQYFDSVLFVVNLTPRTETDVIRLATAADFMWNAASYSKDYSLWKVLASRYGIVNAREIVQYADKYSLLLEIVLKLELNIQVSRNIKLGQQTMAELTKELSDINLRLGAQHKLVKELQVLNAELRNRLNQQIKRNPVKK